MNKKLFGTLLMGSLLMGGTFVSCQDYDDEIADLQSQINDLKGLKTEVESVKGSLGISAAECQSKIDAAIKAIPECDAKKALEAANNAADAAKKAQEVADAAAEAAKTAGLDEAAVKALADAQIAAAKLATLAALDAKADEILAELAKKQDAGKYLTADSLKPLQDSIAALKADAEKATSDKLTSVVFYPNFYVDGIEAEEYGVFDYAALIAQKQVDVKGTNEVKVGGTADYVLLAKNPNWNYDFTAARAITEPVEKVTILDDVKNALAVNKTYGTRQIYNTVGTAEYHINPGNANLEGAKYDFNSRNVQRVGTRANNQLGIKVIDGKADKGILKVDYKGNYSTTNIPDYYGKDEVTDETYSSVTANNTPIFALEVTTPDTTVTSDYAMLYVTPVVPVAIAFDEKAEDDAQKADKNPCPVAGQHNHLYDNPVQAIENAAEWQIQWDATDYFDVTKHLQLHVNKYSPIKNNAAKHAVVKYGEEAQYGLHYEFNLIDYTVGGNVTSDSHYCYNDKVAEGKMKASYVKYEDGTTLNQAGKSSIGKKPLLQVLVKDEAGNVVLDGYVKFEIVEKAEAPVDYTTVDFNLKGNFTCAGLVVKNLWHETSTGLYQFVDNKLGMSKEKFHENYTLDMVTIDGVDQAVQYLDDTKATTANNPAKGNTNDYLGIVTEIPDPESPTNHVYQWSLTAAEQQYVWEQAGNTVTRYVRFTSKTGMSHIYIPLKLVVAKSGAVKAWKEKITNYWFSHTPNAAYTDDPDEAQRLNVPYPTDEGAKKSVRESSDPKSVRSYVVDMNNAFVKNNVIVEGYNDTPATASKKVKFYFSSKTDGVVVTDPNTGKSYTLSTDASKVTCQIWPKNVEMTWSDGIEAKHQILTGTGVYGNKVLYANEGNKIDTTKRVKIAELDQNTGVVTYIWEDGNTIAKQVLNATGHKVAGEYAYIGIFAPDACDFALPVAAPYPAYFLRPLDIDASKEGKVVDAKSNADYVKFGDMLACTDWRDVNLLTKENAWLFAYYGVGKITIDTDNVMTTLNQANSNSKTAKYVKLSDVTNNLKLTYVDQDKNPIAGNTIDLSSLYDDTWTEANSAACYAKLATIFGQIKYENNGNNVYDFWFKVPVTYSYEWGTIVGNIYVNVVRTQGN